MKYILFDDCFIEEKRGVQIKQEPPAGREGPLLVPDKPWESGGLSGDSNMSIIKHNDEYKLWYVVPLEKETNEKKENFRRQIPEDEIKNLDEKTLADYLSRKSYMLCYAVSSDGVNWEKPELGIVDFNGSKKNNIVLTARLGCTVFLDKSAPEDERFKIIYGGGPPLPHYNIKRFEGKSSPEFLANMYHAVYGARSADGIHWKPYPGPVMPWYTDCSNACYRDDENNKYLAFVRWNEGMVYRDGKTISQQTHKHTKIGYRAIGMSESRDFSSFPPPGKILEPSRSQREPYMDGMDYYNTAAVKYPFAPSAHLMFISKFYHYTHMLDVYIATSRNGKNYNIWEEPFLRLGREGNFDSKSIYMASGIVEGLRPGDLWMYYAGYANTHAEPGSSPGGVGRVGLRMDGFISQEFSASGGVLETKPVAVSGEKIRLNMDASAGGSVRLGIKDEKGMPLDDFRLEDSLNIYGNGVYKTAAWKGGACVGDLKGRRVKIRMEGKNVKLYSFSFENNSPGD